MLLASAPRCTSPTQPAVCLAGRRAVQEVLGLVDFCRVSAGARTAGEVGRSATVWVVRNHHTAVSLFDAITIDTSFAATLVAGTHRNPKI